MILLFAQSKLRKVRTDTFLTQQEGSEKWLELFVERYDMEKKTEKIKELFFKWKEERRTHNMVKLRIAEGECLMEPGEVAIRLWQLPKVLEHTSCDMNND